LRLRSSASLTGAALEQRVRRYRDVTREEGDAIVWERLEGYELKWRARGMAGLQPGQRPEPSLPAGTNRLPQIEHIVVLMMENHSYDNCPARRCRVDV
jgi:phospholipase C